MDWIGLAKNTFTFSSSLFDVVSDIINSLTFMGYYNPSTNNATSPSYNNTSVSTNQSSWMNSSEINSTMTTVEYPIAKDGYRVDEIWGMVGFVIVMLPGIVGGFPWVICRLYKREFFRAFGVLIVSLTFPIQFLVLQLVAIIKICCKSNLSQGHQLIITLLTAIESQVESCCQLLLQLFTIINGYDTNTIQIVTIIASFFQMAKVSISLDMENKLFDEKTNLGFKKNLVEVMKRLPCYATTITFRVMSLFLTMAFLRYFSIIPLTLLAIEISALAWMRCKKIEGSREFWEDLDKEQQGQSNIMDTFGLVVSNFGVMTASVVTGENEDVKEIEKFVRCSSILTFIHHSVILTLIMILGWYDPNYMDHWTSPEFRLHPTSERFFWMFGSTLMMGCFSLTTILYRARNIATLEINEQNPDDHKEKVEEIPLQE